MRCFLLRYGVPAFGAALFPFLIAAQALTYEWAGAFLGVGNTYVTAQVVDAEGNIYLQGSAVGNMDLDPGAATVPFSVAGTDMFLVKLNAEGEFQWGHGLTGPGADYGSALQLLANGDLLQVFQFEGTMDLDHGAGAQLETSAGQHDIGVRRISPAGDLIWAKRIGGIGREEPEAVCETPEGELVLVGAFTSVTVLDPAGVQGVHDAGGPGGLTLNMFMVKLDATGNYIWSVTAGGEQHDRYSSVANLPNGNLLVKGTVEYAPADVDPGPGVHTIDPGDGRHSVLLEFNGGGSVVNVREISSTDQADIHEMLVDPLGQVFVLGQFDVDINFGPGTPTLTGSLDGYMAKYGADGSFLWARSFSAGSINTIALTFNQQGEMLFGGWFTSNFDADPGPGSALQVAAGSTDAFLVKVDADGNYRWAHTFGSTGTDQVRAIHVGADGALTVAGAFSGTVDMDPSPATNQLVAQEGMDGYVIRLLEAPCAGLLYQVDTLEPVQCEQLGSIAGTIVGGLAPYTVEWNTTPPQSGTSMTFAAPGTATVEVADGTGCIHTRTLILPGTTYQSFDLTPVLVFTPIRVVNPSHMWVAVVNAGCTPLDAVLQVVLPPQTTFTGAVPPPATVDGDTLTWSLPQLDATIPPLTVQIDFFVEQGTPVNEYICFDAVLLPVVGDEVPANNTQTYCAHVLNSYDPNDKQVIPAGLCDEGFVPMDQVLRYAVRFQNTGNAPALRVVVVDSLSPLLDPASLRLITNSHPMVAEWMPGNVLRFVFDDINLPDSSSNELESHGHVVFELSPVAGHQPGDEVTNNVGIYFDYNDPVITNSVRNTYTATLPTDCDVVGVVENPATATVQIYPNPVIDYARILFSAPLPSDSHVELIDVNGRVLRSWNGNGTREMILTRYGIAAGLYSLRVVAQDGSLFTARLLMD